MGLVDWVRSFFKDGQLQLSDTMYTLSVDYAYRRMAIDSCINLIANALVRCEFKTFQDGKEHRGENYYLLNVSPNGNQNAGEFMKKLVSKLLRENECLVIMQNKQLYVADSFSKKEYALRDNIYSGVTVGDLTFDKSFYESEVLYFKHNDKKIMSVIESLYDSYGKLVQAAMNIYKRSNAKRVILKGDFLRPQTEREQQIINEMFDKQFKPFFEADNAGAVFQLQKGYELDDFSGNGKAGSAAQNSRDVRALVDDILDFVALCFHIPQALLKGNLVDLEKLIEAFLMFCINPIAELVADEFNRKMYTKEEYLARTYLKMDTSKIRILDIVQQATAFDKFFSIGALTINDIIQQLGFEPIDEDWANKRFVTKNYELAENIENTKGGEES